MVPLETARVRYPDHVPCDACFPGRRLPVAGQTAAKTERFIELLARASRELWADNRDAMNSPDLVPTKNEIDPGDVELFFDAVEAGLIDVHRDGRFNTVDRPTEKGRWALLSRSKGGGWYNAEYLPQIAGYTDAILRLGFPRERVLFELPSKALQLDLAILDDAGRVVVLGEAKRDAAARVRLQAAVIRRFGDNAPDDTSKKRGDEARQLAWRLWHVRPACCWFIGPGHRVASPCEFVPLRFGPARPLPSARDLGLDHKPPSQMDPPDLR